MPRSRPLRFFHSLLADFRKVICQLHVRVESLDHQIHPRRPFKKVVPFGAEREHGEQIFRHRELVLPPSPNVFRLYKFTPVIHKIDMLFKIGNIWDITRKNRGLNNRSKIPTTTDLYSHHRRNTRPGCILHVDHEHQRVELQRSLEIIPPAVHELVFNPVDV